MANFIGAVLIDGAFLVLKSPSKQKSADIFKAKYHAFLILKSPSHKNLLISSRQNVTPF
ncbi:MAG: hypothetical protein RRX95_01330 [Oscillospiraceae bacterium]